jgi:hypothetical protein
MVLREDRVETANSELDSLTPSSDQDDAGESTQSQLKRTVRAIEPVTNLAQAPTVQASKTHGPVRRIIMSIVYVAYLLVFVEVAMRLVVSVTPIFKRRRASDDSSLRIAWVKLHGNRPDFNQKYYIFDPTRGWAVKYSVRDMNVFNGKIVNSNSKGLRGKTEYEYDRQPGKHRILVLGDSFTFGDDVSDDETYAHCLESLLPGTEVLNLGVAGYGQDQMLLYLKEEGVKYHPDVVILGYVWWDLARNLWTFADYAKPKFELLRDGSLRLTNVPVPPPDVILHQEFYRSKALDLWVILRERFRWWLGLNQKKGEELAAAIFDQVVSTTRGMGAVPVFVYLPVLNEISDPKETMNANEQYLDLYCRDRGVACLFLRQRFREEIQKGVKFNPGPTGHWQSTAHMIAARRIQEYLAENSLLRADQPESGLIERRYARAGRMNSVGSPH